MPATLIRLDPRQKARLTRRAELHGHSLSKELQYAIDLYLVLSPDFDKELEALARAANQPAQRRVKGVDRTTGFVTRILERLAVRRRVRSEQPGD